MLKTINSIHSGAPTHWVGDGFRVKNYFPGGMNFGKKTSPFFLLDYHPPFEYTPTDRPRGVGVHPHKGFETVTIAFQGSIAHHDSQGGSGIIGPGEVQWMTAGNGVLHKEYHESEFTKKGGTMQMLQLWVNLPARYKSVTPRYQALSKLDMGEIPFGQGSRITLIAGEKDGVKGPAQTYTPIHLWTVDLKKGDTFQTDLPEDFNTAILLTSGSVYAHENKEAHANDFILFDNKGTGISLTADKDSQFVLLSGQPIDEPIAHYGPFVMNTMEEIQEAIRDFQAGKFGVLAE